MAISPTHDPHKRYDALLFKYDKQLLHTELGELQDIFHGLIANLGSQVFPEGRLLAGGEISISGNQAELSDAIVFAQGLPRLVPARTLTIPTDGPADVGVYVQYQVITRDQDPTLVHPYNGSEVADRRQVTISWEVNHPLAVSVFRLLDGALFNDAPPPTLSPIEVAMARRTRNTSGDFLSDGGRTRVEAHDATSVYLVTDPLTAYVTGNEIIRPLKTRTLLETSRSFLPVLSEPNAFNPGTLLYPLINGPARAIDKVTAIVEVTQAVTRGNMANTADTLPFAPVAEIVTVTQGGTTYTAGVDYLRSGNSIDWSLPGDEPAPGTTYTATWRYYKPLAVGVRTKASTSTPVTRGATNADTVSQVDGIRITAITAGATTYTPGVDYIVTVSASDMTITWTPSGNKPTTSTSYTVELDYWAHTVEGDVVVFNSYDTPDLVSPERRNGVDFRTTGEKPVTGSVFLTDYSFYTQRRDLGYLDGDGNIKIVLGAAHPTQPMVPPAPVGTLPLFETHCPPDSTAITVHNLDLARVTMGELRTLLRRFDDFVYNQGVLSLEQEARQRAGSAALRGYLTDNFSSIAKSDVFHPLYTAAINADEQTLELGASDDEVPLTRQTGSTSRQNGTFEGLPFTEMQALAQLKRTDTYNVNQHANFTSPLPYLSLDPRQDVYVIRQPEQAIYLDNYSGGGVFTRLVSSQAVTETTTEQLPFMRSLTVSVTGKGFGGHETDIRLNFGGVPVNLTPTGGSTAGTVPGTIRANAAGDWQGTFQIPANTPAGTVTVTAQSPTGQESEAATYTGSMSSVTQRTTYIRQFQYYDPIAQSFAFEEDRHLTSVGVHFASKDTVLPIRCEIRNMVNGYPGPEIYATKTLQPSQITTTGETRFNFDDPVPIEFGKQYCFALLTDSSQYRVHTATLGKFDPTPATGGWVTANAYTIGDMFTSANAATWVAYPNTDLTFALYCARYSPSATVTYDNVTGTDVAEIALLNAQSTPQGTRLDWEYSTTGGATWLPFQPWRLVKLGDVVNQLQVRARLSTSNPHVSPDFNYRALSLRGRLRNVAGTYISRLLPLTVTPNDCTVYLEMATPSATSQTPQISLDDGVSWHGLTLASSAPVDKDFSLNTFTLDLVTEGVSGTAFRFRLNQASSDRAKTPRARNLIANLS